MGEIEAMTDKEKFEAIGDFVKCRAETDDSALVYQIEFSPDIELWYCVRFLDETKPSAIGLYTYDRLYEKYTTDSIDELIKDLKKRLKYVKEFYDLLEEIDK